MNELKHLKQLKQLNEHFNQYSKQQVQEAYQIETEANARLQERIKRLQVENANLRYQINKLQETTGASHNKGK